jgi:hypothetical protein
LFSSGFSFHVFLNLTRDFSFVRINILMGYIFCNRRKNDELRKDAVDALCCLAHALGEDFTIFIESIHKLLLKHRLRVLHFTIF